MPEGRGRGGGGGGYDGRRRPSSPPGRPRARARARARSRSRSPSHHLAGSSNSSAKRKRAIEHSTERVNGELFIKGIPGQKLTEKSPAHVVSSEALATLAILATISPASPAGEVEVASPSEPNVAKRSVLQASVVVGDRVSVDGYGCDGKVRYSGPHLNDATKGHRMLVELDEPVGNNNGTIKGTRFCAKLLPKTGVLVLPSKVTKAQEEVLTMAPKHREAKDGPIVKGDFVELVPQRTADAEQGIYWLGLQAAEVWKVDYVGNLKVKFNHKVTGKCVTISDWIPAEKVQRTTRPVPSLAPAAAASLTPASTSPAATLSPVPQPPLPSPWQSVWDKENKEYYYWNETTNESTWIKPSASGPQALRSVSPLLASSPSPLSPLGTSVAAPEPPSPAGQPPASLVPSTAATSAMKVAEGGGVVTDVDGVAAEAGTIAAHPAEDNTVSVIDEKAGTLKVEAGAALLPLPAAAPDFGKSFEELAAMTCEDVKAANKAASESYFSTAGKAYAMENQDIEWYAMYLRKEFDMGFASFNQLQSAMQAQQHKFNYDFVQMQQHRDQCYASYTGAQNECVALSHKLVAATNAWNQSEFNANASMRKASLELKAAQLASEHALKKPV